MMYIDISSLSNKVSARWILRSQEYLDELKAETNIDRRSSLIDYHSRHWKLLRELLKSISYNKCWYSETKNPYSHYHIDHFRPKKKVIDDINNSEQDGYWWLAFDFTNFRLCGGVGNTKKGNHFAVKANKVTSIGTISDEIIYFLDPISRDDVKLLSFDNEGKAIPSRLKEMEPWNFERATYTIDKLDLNYPDLVEERRMKWQNVSIMILEVNKLNEEYNREPSNTKKMELIAKKNEIKKLLNPQEELTSLVRACLRSSGQDWAYEILEG